MHREFDPHNQGAAVHRRNAFGRGCKSSKKALDTPASGRLQVRPLCHCSQAVRQEFYKGLTPAGGNRGPTAPGGGGAKAFNPAPAKALDAIPVCFICDSVRLNGEGFRFWILARRLSGTETGHLPYSFVVFVSPRLRRKRGTGLTSGTDLRLSRDCPCLPAPISTVRARIRVNQMFLTQASPPIAALPRPESPAAVPDETPEIVRVS